MNDQNFFSEESVARVLGKRIVLFVAAEADGFKKERIPRKAYVDTLRFL